MASTATGYLTATDPAQARRSWPRRLAAGSALIAVAVVGLFWADGAARLLLGAAGVAAVVRGVLVLRAVAAGTVDERARSLGGGSVLLGAAAVVVAALSATLSGRVLVVAVPVLLFLTAGALLPRGGAVRMGGRVLLVWSALVTGRIVAAGITGGWHRAAGAATVVAGLGLAAVGVVALAGAWTLRGVAARRPATSAYPAPAAGCGGCACGAGGCGALFG